MPVGTAVGTPVEVKRLNITLLKSTGDSGGDYLGGLTLANPNPARNPTFPEGVYVSHVLPERLRYDPHRYLSEASAQFIVGDRVLAMNGQPVSDVPMAVGLARSFPAGPVTITIERAAPRPALGTRRAAEELCNAIVAAELDGQLATKAVLEAELDALLQRAGGHPDLLLARNECRASLQRSLLEGPRAMLLRNGDGSPSAMGSVSVLAEHRTWFLGVVDSDDARVLHDALAVYYAKHASSRVRTVSTLVARVYGGPPCSINGIMVNRVLWTAKALCEQLQAKYGETVPVTFKPDGSLDISEEAAQNVITFQETQLDPEWILARDASVVEAQRRAAEQEAGVGYSEQENEELERALALSRAQHLQEAAHDGSWLGLDFHAPLSQLDSVSLMQAAQRGDAAAVSRLMRQHIQQVAGQPVPLFERNHVRIYSSLFTHPSNNRRPHDTPPFLHRRRKGARH